MHVSGGTSRVWLARVWCAEAITATAIKQRSDRVVIIIEPVVVVGITGKMPVARRAT